MGGIYSEDFVPSQALRDRARGIGLIKDTARFYAACDVLVAPSFFDPCPLVPFEAAARGVPVIATEGVGNLPTLLEYGAGLAWNPEQLLGPLVREAASRRAVLNAGAQRMSADLSEARQGERLLALYREVLRDKQAQPGRRPVQEGTRA